MPSQQSANLDHASQGSIQTLFFDHLFLPSGWARDVRLSIKNGFISNIETGVPRGDATAISGFALPGIPNLHSHAFQRAMAGLAEHRGSTEDSFWTWRDLMYRFVGRLTPEDVEAIAAVAYMEMLERGFTAVGEFHYIHHDPNGVPYADLAEMGSRIVAAATETGIGLTLLPVFYAYGGFGGTAPSAGQRRFLNDPERFAALVERTKKLTANLPTACVGIAPHSLRAVTPETLRLVVTAAETGPIHIHAAEQVREVDDCIAWSGRRPIEWLLANMKLDPRWCLIHATHMTEEETRQLAATGAVVGLCPVTEASLGDGIFNGPEYLAARGRFGVGSDSNVAIDAVGELRQLEYSQRLRYRSRNVMTDAAGQSTGERLTAEVLAGGAQALSRPIGAIEVGRRADIVVLDPEQINLGSVESSRWLDCWIFASERAVKTVLVGGEKVVDEGRHVRRETIASRYRAVLTRLMADV